MNIITSTRVCLKVCAPQFFASKSAHFKNRYFPEMNRPNPAKVGQSRPNSAKVGQTRPNPAKLGPPMSTGIMPSYKNKSEDGIWRWFPAKNGKKSSSNAYPINQSTIEKHGDAQAFPRASHVVVEKPVSSGHVQSVNGIKKPETQTNPLKNDGGNGKQTEEKNGTKKWNKKISPCDYPL